VVATIAVLFVGAFVVDDLLHGSNVSRNVTIAGTHVGGLGVDDLDDHIAALAAEARLRPFVIDGGERTIDATLGDLGVELDEARLRAEVIAAGWEGGVWDDLISWWSSFGEPRNVEPSFVIDTETAEAFIAAHPGVLAYEPVEPSYSGATGALVVNPGRDGLALDPAKAVDAVASVVGDGYPVGAVAVEWDPVPPRIDATALEASLEAADAMASDIGVYIFGQAGTIGRTTVTHWIESVLTDDGLVPRFDLERAEAAVQRLFGSFIDPGTPPEFTVVDGEVIAVLGEEPLRCCAPGFGAALEAHAMGASAALVSLPPTPVYDDAGRAAVEAMGIDEQVGAFTTFHRCCQSRVQNIHRIADLVRGVVIESGGRFSINEFVGQRTREKGFVSAGVISSGHFVDDVGGGISQFATTLFNAAFFAGLDFESYQSHSIYISRYPYGREATLSFPQPDLVITNPTPYSILVWTSYDDTSITVELYSTSHFVVEQSGQSTYRWGRACRRVDTYRNRTAPDGRVLEDVVFATYRPGEGLDCNGNAIARPTG
jgi:vancomycin resistance protein YoaR